MKIPRRRWLTLSEYSLSTSTSSMRRASLTLRSVRVSQLRDDLLEVVAEVPRVVALGLRREAQRLPRGGGQLEGVHDLGHEGVEEGLLGDALEVHEDGEEAPLARLVRGQDALQVVEERRLPDAPLARDHQAVAVERAQHAGGELLPAVEHVVVEDGRPRDVRVEAPAHRAAPPHLAACPSRGPRGPGRPPPPTGGTTASRGSAAAGRTVNEIDVESPPVSKAVTSIALTPGSRGRSRANGALRAGSAGVPPGTNSPTTRPPTRNSTFWMPRSSVATPWSRMVGDSTTSASGLEEGEGRLPVRKPAREEGLAGAPLGLGQALAGAGVARVEPQHALERHLRLREAAGGHELLAVRGQAVDVRPQLLLLPEALEDLPRPREQGAGLGALRARGVGSRRRSAGRGPARTARRRRGPCRPLGPSGGPPAWSRPGCAPRRPGAPRGPSRSEARAAARRRRPPSPPWPCPPRGAARRRRGAARAAGRGPRRRGPPPARRAAAPARGSPRGGCPGRAPWRAPRPGRGAGATRPRRALRPELLRLAQEALHLAPGPPGCDRAALRAWASPRRRMRSAWSGVFLIAPSCSARLNASIAACVLLLSLQADPQVVVGQVVHELQPVGLDVGGGRRAAAAAPRGGCRRSPPTSCRGCRGRGPAGSSRTTRARPARGRPRRAPGRAGGGPATGSAPTSRTSPRCGRPARWRSAGPWPRAPRPPRSGSSARAASARTARGTPSA